ncbi:DUF1361 domain-containing protein [Flavobacterium adhaerens]|uniref:DUF1361 domain-containing protein n=1 Tax=Flavobacterium adhaerens TaxID=3149043 RepID=UPI0032B53947
MQLLIKLFNSDRKTNSVLLLFSTYCLILLFIRAKLTHTFYHFFLVWNLFLAFVPYLFISYLKTQTAIESNKIKTFILLVLWLLFLPNSFYILTDLIHLTQSYHNRFWFDLIVISSYALIGFTIGILSLIEFENIIKNYISPLITNLIMPIICFLSGIGIYLGRILRFNSWDIMSSPMELFYALLNTFTTLDAMLFSFYFGAYIYLFYFLKKVYSSINN